MFQLHLPPGPLPLPVVQIQTGLGHEAGGAQRTTLLRHSFALHYRLDIRDDVTQKFSTRFLASCHCAHGSRTFGLCHLQSDHFFVQQVLSKSKIYPAPLL